MISNRPMVPMLTHVDNLGDLNIDMSTQEQSLQQIAENTRVTNSKLETVLSGMSQDYNQQNDIKANTTFLQTSVGLPADKSTANTVIGLLKSIANKL